MEEWREKAHAYEDKAYELQHELSSLKEKIHKPRGDPNPKANLPPIPLRKQLNKEKLVLLSSHFKKKCHFDEKGFKFEDKEANVEEENREGSPRKELPPLSLGKQLAKEKRMLLRRLKENRDRGGSKPEDGRRKLVEEAPIRSPLRDIGNSSSSPLTRRLAFTLHSPESSRIRDGFRK